MHKSRRTLISCYHGIGVLKARLLSSGVCDDEMKFGLPTLLIATLFAQGARADDVRTDLAHQIRQESTSTGKYVGAETVTYLEITKCEVSSEWAQSTSEGTRIFGYRFDLRQTRLPEIPPQNTIDWGVRDVGKDLPTGEIYMTFIGSHQAQVYGQTKYGFEEWGPIGGIVFSFGPLADLDRPLRLLELLHRYQSQFCLNLG